ncbi:hypothetical protein [Cerasicoccus frondis]|uniref:hypothetical protein n=1 Tax=Cerasicoccus frondis TaxID=490090 RepID=UPI002852D007|nr:hypothetical protein [Cerasicoccus frondis]
MKFLTLVISLLICQIAIAQYGTQWDDGRYDDEPPSNSKDVTGYVVLIFIGYHIWKWITNPRPKIDEQANEKSAEEPKNKRKKKERSPDW